MYIISIFSFFWIRLFFCHSRLLPITVQSNCCNEDGKKINWILKMNIERRARRKNDTLMQKKKKKKNGFWWAIFCNRSVQSCVSECFKQSKCWPKRDLMLQPTLLLLLSAKYFFLAAQRSMFWVLSAFVTKKKLEVDYFARFHMDVRRLCTIDYIGNIA